jgi:hypothetical protein
MIKEMVTACVFWLNMFPRHDGVSATLSPRALMTGYTLDYTKHCRLEFGSYVQTHEEHDNSMDSRTTGAIALRPTGNRQGGYYFMSLSTGRKLTRNCWTALLLPQDMIDCVDTLGCRCHAAVDLTFAWRDGTPIADLDNDTDSVSADNSDYHPADDDSSDNSSQSGASAAGVDDDDDDDNDDFNQDAPYAGEHDEYEAPNEGPNNDDADEAAAEAGYGANAEQEDDAGNDANAHDMDEAPAIEAEEAPMISDDEDDTVDAAPHDPTGVDDTGMNDDFAENTGVDGDSIENTGVDEANPPGHAGVTKQVANIERTFDDRYGPWNNKYNLRARKPREYSHLHPNLEHTAFTQYNVRQGLKIFGEAGAQAVVKEMKQLHDRAVIQPKLANMLTREEKQRSLQYLMFLKQKRCGRIKGHGCANGRKQWVYKTKEETSAPTVCVESLFLSCVIDAKENRKVITCDIPGAFMQADIDEVLHVQLEGPLAQLLTKIDPDLYAKFMMVEGGKDVMYVKLTKVLYGTLQAAMLFWKDLTSYLAKRGFVLNPYDNCIANKMIDGAQCTILWHVDDLKILHVKQEVLEDLIAILNE